MDAFNCAKHLVYYEKLFVNLSDVEWDDEWKAKLIYSIVKTLKAEDEKKTIILVLMQFKFYSPQCIVLIQDIIIKNRGEILSTKEIVFLIDMYIVEKGIEVVKVYEDVMETDLLDVKKKSSCKRTLFCNSFQRKYEVGLRKFCQFCYLYL